jgi:hypothetical protein
MIEMLLSKVEHEFLQSCLFYASDITDNLSMEHVRFSLQDTMVIGDIPCYPVSKLRNMHVLEHNKHSSAA